MASFLIPNFVWQILTIQSNLNYYINIYVLRTLNMQCCPLGVEEIMVIINHVTEGAINDHVILGIDLYM